VQAHAGFGLAALVVGAARVGWPHGEAMDRLLGWSFLGLLVLTAASAALLSRPVATPSLLGVTVGHLFILATALGVAAALWAARAHDRLRWRNIVTALFAGVVVMAGLFELLPGRILNTVLAGG